MKRFYDVQCHACKSVAEIWISLEEIPDTKCPHCGEKKLQRKFSPFSLGSRCGFNPHAPGT
ncbi:MAG: FmdB family zinc ribbon protein [Planctomycetota bacterium]|jgi:putative FmdB family regulatory protein